jgi:cyclic pyranopterin phosphate synthase
VFDSFDREITYLRISVTEACNLRCVYCMPAEGIPRRNPGEELSFERIAEVSRAAVALGMTKIRLTGGEPLMRRDIVKLVGMLSRIPGLDHLAMTTNGTLLGRHARGLREAGLAAVNVSRGRNQTRIALTGRLPAGIATGSACWRTGP